jgi:acetoin utilization deacetylase AcuC-like enzyme
MEGLRRRDKIVFDLVLKQDCPLVITLGGGYSDPIERTAQAHAQTFLAAVEILNTSSSEERLST